MILHHNVFIVLDIVVITTVLLVLVVIYDFFFVLLLVLLLLLLNHHQLSLSLSLFENIAPILKQTVDILTQMLFTRCSTFNFDTLLCLSHIISLGSIFLTKPIATHGQRY